MAMDIATMKTEAIAAAKAKLELDLVTNGPVDSDGGLDAIAGAIGAAVDVALQHVLNNAVTSPTGDTIT